MVRGCRHTVPGGRSNIQEGGCDDWPCRRSRCDGCRQEAAPAHGCYWVDELEGACGTYWSSFFDGVQNYWSLSFNGGYIGYGYTSDYMYCRGWNWTLTSKKQLLPREGRYTYDTIGDVTPWDQMEGWVQVILAEQDRELEAARRK